MTGVFEPIEPYLLGTSMFAVGNPLWLFYLIILLSIFLIIQFIYNICYPLNAKRLSLYYLWLPSAIFTILLEPVLRIYSNALRI